MIAHVLLSFIVCFELIPSGSGAHSDYNRRVLAELRARRTGVKPQLQIEPSAAAEPSDAEAEGIPMRTRSLPVPALPPGCGGQWNTNPILSAAPHLLTSVPNGKLFQLDSVTPPILVAHAWGSHYEMGLALGQMLARPAKILLVRCALGT